MAVLEPSEIVLRLIIALIAGGVVGYERDSKGHAAGVRTHILVSLGAAIAAIVQLEAVEWGIQLVQENPEIASSISFDVARITAQVISGIGFLGAGTIIVTNRSVSGLTTAASIWAIAAIGMAAGMGYHFVVAVGCGLILLVLRVFKQIFRVKRRKRIEIMYTNRDTTLNALLRFFKERDVDVSGIEYMVNMENPEKYVCADLFTLSLPHEMNLGDLIPELMAIPSVLRISTVKEALD